MPRPFFRYVPSLGTIKKQGTDEHFYSGNFYIAIPSAFVGEIQRYCGEHLSSVELGSEDDGDEPISVYVLAITDDDTGQVLAQLKTDLEYATSNVIAEAAAKISGADAKEESAGNSPEPSVEGRKLVLLFSRDLDSAFDSLRGVADLRDYLLRIEAEIERMHKAGDKGDPALLIEV